MMLNGKKILLGISGSIAAYKAAEVARQLISKGSEVKVVMTESATQFISPLTFQALTGHAVYIDQFDHQNEHGMDHIELAKWPDCILIAPASANMLARLAHGFADNLLASVCLAAKKPVYIAPAMNKEMWDNPLTQRNIDILISSNKIFFGPGKGVQACGDDGLGRLLEPTEIVSLLENTFIDKLLLKGKKIIITAGSTHESIDPVRYIANHSSGKMGYALAKAAQQLGAEVTLISGPTHLLPPINVTCIKVVSAQEMYQAVMDNIRSTDIFIANAAVADYQMEEVSSGKIKKVKEELILKLVPTKDILYEVSRLEKTPYLVGFAAETDRLLENAKEKLDRKNLDMVVANPVGAGKSFARDDIHLTVLTRSGEQKEFPMQDKEIAARKLLEYIGSKLRQK